MTKLRLWDKETPLIYANGVKAEPEQVNKDYPFTQYAPTVLTVMQTTPEGIMIGGIDNLYLLRNNCDIDTSLSDEEIVWEIEQIRNQPVEEPDATPEERIAAMLEFQVMMSLPDEN